ncbi:tautomerase family protein [Mycolicibacterium goodii]|uniref:tautomerase family protein n=1 Tax=Mycolicibacterium goodii TaxID=134601 RepID=UPI0027E015E0|nr:tautomerase family protein [Mycolicibacterium goodii]
MPVYTCTTVQSTLNADTKANLATEVTRIHSMINHVPSAYVNVVFHELPPTPFTPTANLHNHS